MILCDLKDKVNLNTNTLNQKETYKIKSIKYQLKRKHELIIIGLYKESYKITEISHQTEPQKTPPECSLPFPWCGGQLHWIVQRAPHPLLLCPGQPLPDSPRHSLGAGEAGDAE